MRVFVGIGSNIRPEENFREAIRRLERVVHVTAVSTVYLTEPEGRLDQPKFYNGVIEIATDLPPDELRTILRRIEEELGRARSDDKFAPRTIDLDILLYGSAIIEDLNIPDPEITERAFLSIPLYELAPDLLLPGSGSAISRIAAAHRGHDMTALEDYTETLRKELNDGPRKSSAAHQRSAD